jgi:replicative DNA helicase
MFGIQEQDGEATEGLAEIIIGKQRNGPTDTIKLQFIKQYARFESRTAFRPETFLPAETGGDETAF